MPGGADWTAACQVMAFLLWRMWTTCGCSPGWLPWCTTGAQAQAAPHSRPSARKWVCPFIADQPFWASLAQQRSVAPVPEPQRHLAAGLASAITTATATTDSDMSRAAQELGHRVSAEDGISAAVTVVERVAA